MSRFFICYNYTQYIEPVNNKYTLCCIFIFTFILISAINYILNVREINNDENKEAFYSGF